MKKKQLLRNLYSVQGARERKREEKGPKKKYRL